MPLYIPWLTETIKKRGVRYLLHHYLGQFFEEKLTLEQLSIDIYEGKGSIRNLALDVDGLNDELDFIPFRFLEGCLIGQISVEVPWSSLATEACRVELDGAKFYCRLKTSADAAKPHCTESTLLSRSLMTSSMQMAEEIVTTEDDDDTELPSNHNHPLSSNDKEHPGTRRKDANQMFEGLEMFAQLIDSVLRRTKLTARDTLFQIKPHRDEDGIEDCNDETDSNTTSRPKKRTSLSSKSSGDEFGEPLANSDTDSEDEINGDDPVSSRRKNQSEKTVEFFIKFFRCEEMVDQQTSRADNQDPSSANKSDEDHELGGANKSLSALPETITKLLTLEDVEMRIDGIPVSNLVGKHTITIKFNGQKSEISIFSGSPLLAVISHKQLETFFNVFDGAKDQDMDSSFLTEKDQKLMSPEDYAKIENQLLDSASLRNIHQATTDSRVGGGSSFGGIGGNSVIGTNKSPYYAMGGSGTGGARRWVESGEVCQDGTGSVGRNSGFGYNQSTQNESMKQSSEPSTEPTLDHIEAFSCELKLPGIWLCILRDGEALPPLIKPYADSINSFQSINKYIDSNIKSPHIRLLALKVALDITATGTNIFLGDLDISEHLEDSMRMSPVLKLLNNDQAHIPMNTSRYKTSITNGRDITVNLLTKTRIMFDPTIIDRLVYDYKLFKLGDKQQHKFSGTSKMSRHHNNRSRASHHLPTPVSMQSQQSQRGTSTDFNLTICGEAFKVELLCPIPDLTPEAQGERTQLRPQSFIFDFKDVKITWQSDKLKISSNELEAFVKTQPMQSDSEAVRFIEASSKLNDKILLLLEPSPSNLDNDFTQDIEQALNESSMYESIYVSQATESKIPTEPFQTKRKVVRASFQQDRQTSNKPNSARLSECDHEKILTPGERQHLLDYLNQTVMSTKLSLDLHLPICEVEFEDKEQLDLIYNRFGNDFVFWQPKAFTKDQQSLGIGAKRKSKASSKVRAHTADQDECEQLEFKRPVSSQIDNDADADDPSSDADNEGSEVSFHSMSHGASVAGASPTGDLYNNEVTCKIIVDELFVKFNHQSCAAALKQEISADNFLLGVVIDVGGKPNTLLSLVADNLELSTDLETVLEGNTFGSKSSVFALTAEIKRPTKALKDIKLAIQLKDGLLNDFRTETYTRFWQSINVTDEPVLGYVAPQIVTELHIDILNTGLLLVREGARPALLSIDELYLTSMVMAETSQPMIRLIADEVSLYMKRDKQGLEVMKNYVCLIDSGLIDLDLKFADDLKRFEFGVINNVITVRVCQDSLNALSRLFNVLIRNSMQAANNNNYPETSVTPSLTPTPAAVIVSGPAHSSPSDLKDCLNCEGGQTNHTPRDRISNQTCINQAELTRGSSHRGREMDLLVDAMNDYTLSSANTSVSSSSANNKVASPRASPSAGEAQIHDQEPRQENNSGASDRCDNQEAGEDADSYDSGRSGDKDKSEHDDADEEDETNEWRKSVGGGTSDEQSDGDERISHADESDESEEEDTEEEEDEEEEEDDEDENDYDSDAPPAFQRASSSSGSISNGSRLSKGSSGSGHSGGRVTVTNTSKNDLKQRDPNACLLDESNSMLGDLFSPPLLPITEQQQKQEQEERRAELLEIRSSMAATSASANLPGSRLGTAGGQAEAEEPSMTTRPMDESGFFVIGDDDVGAGIIDKKQHEPVVRRLIDGPINIVENHFKMTRPRTLPEILVNSLERYVLEEMTLVVNLYGGRDFDDDEITDDEAATNDDDGEAGITKPTRAQAASTASSDAALIAGAPTARTEPGEATANESHDITISGGTSENQSIRGRAGSVASTRRQLSTESGSLRRTRLASVSSGYGGSGASGRRKHLSEGSGGGSSKSSEQRVRFGEGAVNLWESLDLMSSPDFLGAGRASSSQPAISSETKQVGGPWRQNDVCIQLTLSKMKLLYELADNSGREMIPSPNQCQPRAAYKSNATTTTTGPASTNGLSPAIAWRFMLFIQDIEVKDRIAASDINKMLYEYCNESMPKRSTQMLTIKNIATVNPSDGCEECDLRVSLKPLRLNIDQDTLLFLIEFFTTFCKSLTKQQSIYQRHQQQQQPAQTQQWAATNSAGLVRGRGGASGVTSATRSGGKSMASSKANPAVNLSKRQATATCSGDNSAYQNQRATTSGGGPRNREVTRNESLGENNLGARTQVAHGAGLAATTSGSKAAGAGALGNHGCTRHDSLSSVASSDSSHSAYSYDQASQRAATAGSLSAQTSKRASLSAGSEHGLTGHDEDYDSEEGGGGPSLSSSLGASGNTGRSSDTGDASRQGADGGGSMTTTKTVDGATEPLPTHCHSDNLSGPANHQPIYIKSFTFSPDVPIRIDYHAKHLNFEQGALAGILMGLAHLDHSELILRRVQAKHGMRGLDRVLLFAINSWLSDIKRNQLPSILGGVGPMHSVIQLFQGVRDLIWMPIDHYRKDGRLVRGLQRGASSFSSSTAMAAINLVNRFISIVQCTAQIAHDIVTPPSGGGGSHSGSGEHRRRRSRPLKVAGGQSSGGSSATGLDGNSSGSRRRHHRNQGSLQGVDVALRLAGAAGPGGYLPAVSTAAGGGLNQPRNFCEGVAVGFTILKEGFNDTARNVTVGMQAEDMRSAVGELVRQIPSTLLNPIISATEGAQSVLVGIRNQIAPDARRDDQEKWKGRVRGK